MICELRVQRVALRDDNKKQSGGTGGLAGMMPIRKIGNSTFTIVLRVK